MPAAVTFIESTGFQTLTWLRIVGGSIFTLGGVIPLIWFIIRGNRNLKKGKTGEINVPSVYEKMSGMQMPY